MYFFDYDQNIEIPHFGTDQPGATYFLSPLGVYVFGICNWKSKQMNAYVYDESNGRKGGNNVVSLLWKYICDNKLNIGKTRPKLSLVCDNCSGQNKNRMVMKFCLLLVEKKL